MAVKSNSSVAISREAIALGAQYSHSAAGEVRKTVEAATGQIRYLTDEQNLRGAEAKIFQDSMRALQVTCTSISRKLDSLAGIFKKMADTYCDSAVRAGKPLEEAKQAMDAFRAKIEARKKAGD